MTVLTTNTDTNTTATADMSPLVCPITGRTAPPAAPQTTPPAR